MSGYRKMDRASEWRFHRGPLSRPAKAEAPEVLDTKPSQFSDMTIEELDPYTSNVRLTLESHVPTEQEIRWRMRGYLDALRGLEQDGYPDPRFIEYLVERTGDPLPKVPLTDSVIMENKQLRQRVEELENERRATEAGTRDREREGGSRDRGGEVDWRDRVRSR